MKQHPTFRQLVIDVFQRHNPLGSDCLSVYDSVVNDLFRYWSYSDTIDELETYIEGVLAYHSKKNIVLNKELVLEVYNTRKMLL